MKYKAFALITLTITLLLTAVGVRPQQVFTEKDLDRYIRENYDKQEVYIPMRDGVRLFTSIYTPKGHKEKWPIMLDRTPYSVGPYGKDDKGKDQYKTLLGPDELFAREGYIFAYQDVRGRMMSEGTFADVRPVIENKQPGQTDESTDAWDTIDWL
jgi:predicted acyl esterase